MSSSSREAAAASAWGRDSTGDGLPPGARGLERTDPPSSRLFQAERASSSCAAALSARAARPAAPVRLLEACDGQQGEPTSWATSRHPPPGCTLGSVLPLPPSLARGSGLAGWAAGEEEEAHDPGDTL